jgi:hypothetical protein
MCVAYFPEVLRVLVFRTREVELRRSITCILLELGLMQSLTLVA